MKKTGTLLLSALLLSACSTQTNEAIVEDIDNEQELLEEEISGVDPEKVIEQTQVDEPVQESTPVEPEVEEDVQDIEEPPIQGTGLVLDLSAFNASFSLPEGFSYVGESVNDMTGEKSPVYQSMSCSLYDDLPVYAVFYESTSEMYPENFADGAYGTTEASKSYQKAMEQAQQVSENNPEWNYNYVIGNEQRYCEISLSLFRDDAAYSSLEAFYPYHVYARIAFHDLRYTDAIYSLSLIPGVWDQTISVEDHEKIAELGEQNNTLMENLSNWIVDSVDWSNE